MWKHVSPDIFLSNIFLRMETRNAAVYLSHLLNYTACMLLLCVVLRLGAASGSSSSSSATSCNAPTLLDSATYAYVWHVPKKNLKTMLGLDTSFKCKLTITAGRQVQTPLLHLRYLRNFEPVETALKKCKR